MPFVERLKSSGRTDIPLNKRAYVLFHMGKQKVYEPDLMKNLEMNLSLNAENKNMQENVEGEAFVTARFAMGAVCGYWRLNYGAAFALKYWEHKMVTQANDLHVQDVMELCYAFRENRTHHRDHLRGIITKYFKKNMIENLWAS